MTLPAQDRRLVAAIVLALLGTIGLVGYVHGAKDDAVAGEKLVKVYVASDKIPAGTRADQLRRRSSQERSPPRCRPRTPSPTSTRSRAGHLDRHRPRRAAR